jgi:hypothetical protein
MTYSFFSVRIYSFIWVKDEYCWHAHTTFEPKWNSNCFETNDQSYSPFLTRLSLAFMLYTLSHDSNLGFYDSNKRKHIKYL